MECDRCGAVRPRTGQCPNCGAPPPRNGGARSSMRDWRQPGPDESRRGGGGGGRGGRQAWDQGYDDDAGGWDDEPRGRRRRGDPGYEDVDLERALVPQGPGGLAPMPPQQGGALAVPGYAGLDDEERALGIRRPVYIPATSDKPKVRPRTLRVLSGVLSVLLMCVASCAAAGILGREEIAKLLPSPIKTFQTPVTINYGPVPATPIATVGPAGTYVHGVYTATLQGQTYVPTTHFNVGQFVYVVVPVTGLPKGQQHVLTIRWYLAGVDLGIQNLKDANLVQRVPPPTGDGIVFKINYPAAGVGEAKIFWDLPANDDGTAPNDPHLAAAIMFGFYQPTPTPAPPTKTTGATKTPGK